MKSIVKLFNLTAVLLIFSGCGGGGDNAVTTATQNNVTLETINKVANVTRGDTEWADTGIEANKGDIVTFYIYFINNGAEGATNIIVKDSLPEGLAYIPSSTLLYVTNGVQGQVLSDTVTTTGISLGTLSPGNQYSGYVTLQVRVSDSASGTLINTGSVSADNASTVTNTAEVMIQ